MAKKATKDKKGKNKSDKVKVKSDAAVLDAPKIHEMKGGLTPAAFTLEIIARMEEDLRISKKQAADFVESLVVVVEEELGRGNPVNFWHLAKLVPRYHSKGERMINSDFNDKESPKVKKKYAPKVSLAVKRGSKVSGKKGLELLPTVNTLAKKVA